MVVKESAHLVVRRLKAPVFLGGVAIAGTACRCVAAVGKSHHRLPNPYFGSVTAHPANDETLKLSLDDAVRRGLENNLGLKEAESGEKQFQGEKNEALQEFLPTIGVRGSTGVYQHNLAALGFKRSVLEDFPQLPEDFSLITRNDLTQGLVTYQTDAVFRTGDRRLEGSGRSAEVSVFRKNVSAGRGGAASCNSLSACDCGCERSGQRDCTGSGRQAFV